MSSSSIRSTSCTSPMSLCSLGIPEWEQEQALLDVVNMALIKNLVEASLSFSAKTRSFKLFGYRDFWGLKVNY